MSNDQRTPFSDDDPAGRSSTATETVATRTLCSMTWSGFETAGALERAVLLRARPLEDLAPVVLHDHRHVDDASVRAACDGANLR